MDSQDRLVVLDAGRTSCVVIYDGDQVVVVNAPRAETLLRYLGPAAVIDKLLLTSSAFDFLSAAGAVLLNCTVRDLYINPDAPRLTRAWEEFLTAVKMARAEYGTRVHTSLTSSYPGEIVGSSFRIEILWPTAEEVLGAKSTGRSERHSQSAVIRVTHPRLGAVLLTNDLDNETLNTLLAQAGRPELQANVLVFPHHGRRSLESTSAFVDRLMSVVQPTTVLLTGAHHEPGDARDLDVLADVQAGAPLAEIVYTAKDRPIVLVPT